MAQPMWSYLRATMLAARYRAQQPCGLPPYKGTTFRGALGNALRQVGCRQHDQPCEGCCAARECVYGALFEAGRAELASGEFDRPVPYVLLPPLDDRVRFCRGEELELRLTLIGSARQWLSRVHHALSRIGEAGLGDPPGLWELASLCGIEPDAAKPLPTDHLQETDWPAEWEGPALAGGPTEADVTIQFLTPTLLEQKDQLRPEVTGTLIFKRLLRRLGGLAQRYCGWNDPSFNFRDLADAAAQIRCENRQVAHIEWNRYSTRQQHHMPLSGFVGQVTLRGVPAELHPYLAAGQWFHIGRRATFGMGTYRLMPAAPVRR